VWAAGAPGHPERVAQQRDPATERIGELLTGDGRTLAIAESLTGGELSARFAATTGSSDWYRGALVAYASEMKHDVLGVPPGPVVSEPAAATMVDGVVRLLGADVGLAVTGVAGPAPQDGREPGTVWFAVRDADGTHTRLERFSGSPEEVVDRTARCAIDWLCARLDATAR
jgi:nicotinamide-nucleotide amidase